MSDLQFNRDSTYKIYHNQEKYLMNGKFYMCFNKNEWEIILSDDSELIIRQRGFL